MPKHITLVVRRAISDGPGTRRLVLQDPDGWPLPRWKPGAHLDLHVPGIGHRSYTMCGDTARTDTWEIAVRRETTSRGGSAWLHDVLNEGDVVAASMPRCTFPIADSATRHVMVAGGIGVTPFLAMGYEFERRGAEWALHVLSRGETPCATALAGWAHTGRIRVHDTTRLARPSWDELLSCGPVPGLHAYCCGPQAMLDGFEKATATWPARTTSIEHFVPPTLPAAEGAKSYRLCRSTTEAEMEVELGALARRRADPPRPGALAGTTPDPPDGLRCSVRVGTAGGGGLIDPVRLACASRPARQPTRSLSERPRPAHLPISGRELRRARALPFTDHRDAPAP
jgi:ferredoxin-NADP reductase